MVDLATDHVVRTYSGDHRQIVCGPAFVTDSFADHHFPSNRRSQLGAAERWQSPTPRSSSTSGEVLVLDDGDQVRPIELRWLGMPFGW